MRIRTPRNAAPAVEYAAEELRRAVSGMAGLGPQLRGEESRKNCRWDGAICLDDRSAAGMAGIRCDDLDLGPEAFHLETRNGDLHILGGSPRGVLYGVYELLDRLGCRWFTPEIARVPRAGRVLLPRLALTGAPAFEFRDMWIWDCRDPVWWARNRMNGRYSPVPKYMGDHVSYGMFVHTFNQLVPPEEFFDRHPEYFSMIDGRRRKEGADGGQLCLTNPNVLQIVVDRVLRKMREQPGAALFSVSQNDGYGYCECPACSAVAAREGAQSGPIVHFVNQVAEATSRKHPDKLIDTLAYQYSLDAPRHVRPHPNVRMRLCPIRCCQGHGFGACDHAESRRFLRALRGWSAITRQIYIWHYCTDFRHYVLPMPNFDELEANIRLYKRLGVHGVFMQGMGQDGGGGESMPLRGYAIARLLWDPTRSIWDAVDEFLPACYGAAAPFVRQYLDLFHRRVREDRNLHPSCYDPPASPLFTGDIVKRADRALAEGGRHVRGDQRLRVNLLRDGLSYVEISASCGRFRRVGNVFRGDARASDARRFESMLKHWAAAGMRSVQESRDLLVTATRLRNRLLPHRIARLTAPGRNLVVVPDLGGRILEWHVAGRQWLAQPDPGDEWPLYPMAEGYVEFVIPRALGWPQGWFHNFDCAAGRNELRLKAALPPGLTLERRLRFSNGRLVICSRLHNTGRDPQDCQWGAGVHLLPPGPAKIEYTDRAGQPRHILSTELQDGYGNAKVLSGASLPADTLSLHGDGWVLDCQFRIASLQQVAFGRKQAANSLALDLTTAFMRLASGEFVEMVQQMQIDRKDALRS